MVGLLTRSQRLSYAQGAIIYRLVANFNRWRGEQAPKRKSQPQGLAKLEDITDL